MSFSLQLNLRFCTYFKEQIINVKSFEFCKQLTRLSISHDLIDNKFFEDIDKYLPNLREFNVSTEAKISEIALNSLTKLNKIESTGLWTKSVKYLTDEGIISLVNNCPQIKSIQVYEMTITHKTIDALKALALKKPHIQFNDHFNAVKKKNKK